MNFKNLKGKKCFNCIEGLVLQSSHIKERIVEDLSQYSNNRYTKKGLLYGIYTGQKSSSKKRGHLPPSYTLGALIQWCISQKHYSTLFNVWENSNYLHELVPSINRLDETKGYSLDNIELLTWGEHRKKANGVGKKRVIQTTLKDVFVKEFESCSDAARQLNIRNGANIISLIARGKKENYKGFKFCYPD